MHTEIFIFPFLCSGKQTVMASNALFLSTVLLILFTSFPSTLQENVSISISSVTTIARTDDNFICATMDWWPVDKCNYGVCPWGNSSLIALDLENPILHKAVKAFKPLRLRLGGSLQDQLIYKVGKSHPWCQNFRLDSQGLFNFTTGCLTMCRWDELNALFNETGAVITFGLNALLGRKKGYGITYVGDWDSSNARAFINYTAAKGYNVHSWELGNELCGAGVSARIEAEQYGKDVIALRNIVDEVYKNSSSKAKVLAPGGFYDQEWFDEMLQTSGQGVVDGVTHHIYNLGPGNDPSLLDKIQDPYYLDQVAQTFSNVANTIKNYGPWSHAWIGESGGAYNNGGINVSNSYVNSFWYLDQLGMASTFDHKVYCRQALIGGNYALLDTTTFVPNPDYYSALLWSQLMGSKVLRTTINGSPYLRAYTHCSKNQTGITMLMINLSNSTSFDVSVNNDLNLYPAQSSSSAVPEGEREEYHLAPQHGNIRSRVMLLNGQPLTLTSTGDIPQMNPISFSSNTTLQISPLSIAFVRLKDFQAPACQ